MSKFVYMEIAPGSSIMRFRGECSDEHDVDSHAHQMAKHDYVVECHASLVGKEVKYKIPGRKDPITHIEYERGTL